MPPRHSARRRSQPQRYQSDITEREELERRNRARGRWRESQEEVSHNWEEGTRFGEAANPGPDPNRIHGLAGPHTHARTHGKPNTNHKAIWGKGHQARGSCGPRRRRQERFTPGLGGMVQPAMPLGAPHRKAPHPVTPPTKATPGNVGLPGAEDLRPGWPAGSQPNTLQPTGGGTPGVLANHWQGVSRHAVNPGRPAERAHFGGHARVCRHALKGIKPGRGPC